MRIRLFRRGNAPDYVLITITFLLVIFGLVMLASASSDLAKRKFDDSYFYLKHQILYGISLGIIGFWLASKIYYKMYQKYAFVLLLLGIGLLISIFTPLGFSAGGADRWLRIGSVVFQPSELLKIFFIIYMAAWLSGREERKNNFWKGFVPFLLVSGLITFLLIRQPSTSTVVILMGSALAVYFASGARLRFVAGIIALGVLGLALVAYSSPYRRERIMTFLNPETNLESSGYHINQAKIAIGVGGLLGVGYGQSTTKILYLPEVIGDSIFVVIAEELGFVGVIFLLLLFVTFVIRGFLLARSTNDQFGNLLLIGFSALITIQTFIHIGAMSGLLPLTGTPLPFVSYGGTALAVFMTISGIMVNISKYN